MLCLHFDLEPEHLPLEELNLRYWIESSDYSRGEEITNDSKLILRFIYENELNDSRRFKELDIVEEEGKVSPN